MCQLDKPLTDTSIESLTQVLTSQSRYIDKRNELKHSHYEDGDDNNKD